MYFLNPLKALLTLPEMKLIRNLDDPATSLVHAQILRKKPLLRKVYGDFYSQIRKRLPASVDRLTVVELGSGGGFIKEVLPLAVTSDVIKVSGVDLCFSGLEMPFAAESIDAFVMINVFHHVHNSRIFLREIVRCLKPNGKLIMVEPANTQWTRFMYRSVYHEPFNLAGGWGFEKSGRLSGANQALPWIIFCRDRERFESEFPTLHIKDIMPYMPFRYLVAGGLSIRQLAPSRLYSFFVKFETLIQPLNRYLGMFMVIEVEKSSAL